MTQTDWHRLIDTSFEEGPGVDDAPHDALRDGHRALRRRRLRVGGIAGGAVLATALLTSVLVSLPGDQAAPGRAVASHAPSVTEPGPDPQPPARAREVYRTAVGPLYLDRDTGLLELPEGWRELNRLLDPVGPGSIALEMTNGGPPLFMFATTRGERGLIVLSDRHHMTFDEFVTWVREEHPRFARGGAK
jgi:hypothetical protein